MWSAVIVAQMAVAIGALFGWVNVSVEILLLGVKLTILGLMMHVIWLNCFRGPSEVKV